MSELVVGSIAGLASNSYVVDVSAGSTLDLSNATSLPSSALPTGSVLQVVSTTKVNTFTTTSSSFVDVTGLSASITPKSTSSKILCLVDVNLVASNNEIPSIQLVRGATAIGGGTAAGSRYSAFSAQYTATTLGSGMIGGSFLDSPNTTSSTTYKVQTLIRNAGSVTVNAMSNDLDVSVHPRLSSTITLMEIAG